MCIIATELTLAFTILAVSYHMLHSHVSRVGNLKARQMPWVKKEREKKERVVQEEGFF